MDGVDRVIRRRKSLTERLGLKGIGCCGSTWGIMPDVVDDENDDVVEVLSHHIHTPPETPSARTACLAAEDGSSRMNLAAALAAERHFRGDHDNNDEIIIHSGSRPYPTPHSRPDETGPRNDVPTYSGSRLSPAPHSRPDERSPRNDVPTYLGSRPSPDSHSSPLRPNGRRLNSEAVNIHSSSRSSSSRSGEGISRNAVETPTRMSLMMLLEETEVYEGELLTEDESVGSDSVCCVCMRRKKGAAFIPCGHTFCRVCSRELWVNRGCCPLCNRSILEILDIY